MTRRVLLSFRQAEVDDTRKESSEIRSEGKCFQYFLECFKTQLSTVKGHCLLFLEHGFLQRCLSSFRPS